MKHSAKELAELALIDLMFAQAEITTNGDRESIVRALEHVAKATRWMQRLHRNLEKTPGEKKVALTACKVMGLNTNL